MGVSVQDLGLIYSLQIVKKDKKRQLTCFNGFDTARMSFNCRIADNRRRCDYDI
ncbi:hypothetical protein [Oenococcus oeni]|uniref:hypothetical protein n=1 Tax=Oenococcus oeni TaxID=1247 RepID=UPI003BF8B976